MVEIWKPVVGYEDRYMVSNIGNVKSLYTRHGNHGEVITHYAEKPMRKTDNGHGYLVVSLRNGGERKNHYVHRLVALAFLEREDGKNYINHKNYNTADNKAENLEWCTQRENVAYSIRHLCKEKSVCKPTNTGHKYIRRIVSRGLTRYRFICRRLGVDKQFKLLDDAVEYKRSIFESCYAIGRPYR